MFNPGKIKIKSGKWAETCTVESNLTANQMKAPAIRDFIEHANKRAITTLLVSGAVGKHGIGNVDDSKKIGNNAYQFDVWTRIQQPVEINSQIGVTQPDGSFQLSVKENYWYEGMNVLFHGAGFQARVMSHGAG